MNSNLDHRRPAPSLPFTTVDGRRRLLDAAQALYQAADAGAPQRPLRGKNIALLSESYDADDTRDLIRAATEAGAQVARIRPSEAGLHDLTTARMLGRLYDAILCEGMPAELVCTLRRETGVPVHADLCDLLPDLQAEADAEPGLPGCAGRTYLLQALLVDTLG
ncbi:hypothetical protein [Caldimonas thermodepolymerans]|uniref:hypothetical protein n=1 Tax=Caldimonas thermodepolymerans TaxID=215580 RepID=UPI002236039B|nr:hypothetical protein [Caldimonas thermodepolymerans]UZG42666.1 hypothetical protein ONZ46_09470 [Caldimonas thermodepolymerans]